MDKRFLACRSEDPWAAKAQFRRIELRRSAFVSFEEAEHLLATDLAAAESRVRQANSNDNMAKYLRGALLQRKGRFNAARAVLEALTESQPHIGPAWSALGLTLQELGEHTQAVDSLLRAVESNPIEMDAWYALGLLAFPQNDMRDVPVLSDGSAVRKALTELDAGQLQTAESILREALQNEPADTPALKLLADILISGNRWDGAKALLEKCLELTPIYRAARFRLSSMLVVHEEYRAAIPHIEQLLKSDPDNRVCHYLAAIAFAGNGDYQLATTEYENLIEASPDRPGLWMQYAKMVKTLRPESCAALLNKVLERFPLLVEATYQLATVKSFRFDDTWIERIRKQLDQPDLDLGLRAQLHFVLGKAFEDLQQYAKSFRNYKLCNDVLRAIRRPDMDTSEKFPGRAKTVLTRSFLRARAGAGCNDSGAIFIVGLPRSGSTLVEQILSSHSAIEGLGELPDLPSIIESELNSGIYPNSLKNLEFERFRSLGERYMAITRERRQLGRPFFTDKLPGNYSHVALIHLMLPNARIIDVRRHPLDCGLSCYKHYFPGQMRALSRRTMGRWYRDYVEVMAHFDDVLPGRVHRVFYEQLVENPAQEVGRVLEYCGIPFEEQCLLFHETTRSINTISADQVRMPLYETAVSYWRHYEQWLDPMKEELGCVLDAYPDAPEFYPRVKARVKPHILGISRFYRTIRGTQQPAFEPAPL